MKEKNQETEKKDPNRWGSGEVKIKKVQLRNELNVTSSFRTGEKGYIDIEFEKRKMVKDATIGIAIVRVDGVHCYGVNTDLDRFPNFDIDKDGKMIFKIDEITLLPGQYTLDVAIECMGMPIDYWREAVTFGVFSQDADVGVVKIKHSWELVK